MAERKKIDKLINALAREGLDRKDLEDLKKTVDGDYDRFVSVLRSAGVQQPTIVKAEVSARLKPKSELQKADTSAQLGPGLTSAERRPANRQGRDGSPPGVAAINTPEPIEIDENQPYTLPSGQTLSGADIGKRVGSAQTATAPSWFLNLSKAEQRKHIAEFNATYGTNYDLVNPANSGALADPRFGTVAVVFDTPSEAARLAEPPGTTTALPGGESGLFPTFQDPGMFESWANELSRSREGRALTPHFIEAANKTNAAWNRYAGQLADASYRHGVPAEVLWGLLHSESSFNPAARNGKHIGIAQINAELHNISAAQARDPNFAIPWAAKYLSELYAQYGDWALAVLHYKGWGNEAKRIRQDPHSNGPQLPISARRQLQKVFSPAAELGYNFADALFDPETGQIALGAGNQAGGGSSGPVRPDPVSVQEFAKQTIESMFFRTATPQEVEALSQMVNGLFDQAAAARTAAQPNPYDSADAVPTSIVNPVKGGGRFGDDWHAARSGGRKHAGVDIFAPEGTEAVAAIGGTVRMPGNSGGAGGWRVWIEGDDGRFYYYAHLVEGSTNHLKEGQRIEQGQVVGQVGRTGNATGTEAHLHFGINTKGIRSTGRNPEEQGWIPPHPELGGAPVETPSPADDSGKFTPDSESRIREFIRSQPEYEELYGRKPDYMSEEQYAQQFVSAGQNLTGSAPGNEAVRQGLKTADVGTTVGFISGGQEALESGSMRQRIFQTTKLFNEML